LAAALLGQMGEAAADHPEVLSALMSTKDDFQQFVPSSEALKWIMDSGVRIFVRGKRVIGKTVTQLARYPPTRGQQKSRGRFLKHRLQHR
jgi:hypothetical protein